MSNSVVHDRDLWDSYCRMNGVKRYEVSISLSKLFAFFEQEDIDIDFAWIYECCDKIPDSAHLSDPYCPIHGGRLERVTIKD